MTQRKGYFRVSRLRDLTDVEAAWIGAFIDAEGSIVPQRGCAGWYINVANTEIEYLATLLRVTGVGSISLMRHHNPLGQKVVWQWRVSATLDVQGLCQRIAPWSLKARPVEPVIALARPPKRLKDTYNGDKTHCPRGHEYTYENTYNYRGRGRSDRRCRTCLRERQRRAA